MSFDVLMLKVEKNDLEKLRQAKTYSDSVSGTQQSLFSLKRVQRLYSELASKYDVEKSELMLFAAELVKNDEAIFCNMELLSGFNNLRNKVDAIMI